MSFSIKRKQILIFVTSSAFILFNMTCKKRRRKEWTNYQIELVLMPIDWFFDHYRLNKIFLHSIHKSSQKYNRIFLSLMKCIHEEHMNISCQLIHSIQINIYIFRWLFLWWHERIIQYTFHQWRKFRTVDAQVGFAW